MKFKPFFQRQRAATKRRQIAGMAMTEADELTKLGLWDPEKQLERFFCSQGLVRGKEEPLLDFAARYFGVNGDQLRKFVDAMARGDAPEPFGTKTVREPLLPTFYRAIALMKLCLDKERTNDIRSEALSCAG